MAETVCGVPVQQWEPILCNIPSAVLLNVVVKDISSQTSLAPIMTSLNVSLTAKTIRLT